MWLTPSLVASTVASLVLMVTYLYLYVVEKRRFLGIWTVAWFAYAIRLSFMLLWVNIAPLPIFTIGNQLCSLANALLLLIGTREFVGKRPPKVNIAIAPVIAVYIVLTSLSESSLLLISFPTFFYLGLACIYAGVSLLRMKRSAGIGARVAGVVLIIWGVHKMDYPFLRSVEWFAPIGYLIAALFALMSALSMVILYFDITKRALVDSQERLAQKYKMESVGQLAGGIAHDFNNVLTTILGYAEYLDSAADDPEEVRSSAREIRTAAERAADITRHLLAFGRKQIIYPQAIDLNRFLSETYDFLSRSVGEHIRIELNLAHNLPSITADEGQLHQVVMNLAVNGRDAMQMGGRLLIATSFVERLGADEDGSRFPNGAVMLEISDEGAGMSRETQKRVFEPFFTTKEIGKGTGLGLATVFGIVEQNGGTITVSSRVGVGTCFRVFFRPSHIASRMAAPKAYES